MVLDENLDEKKKREREGEGEGFCPVSLTHSLCLSIALGVFLQKDLPFHRTLLLFIEIRSSPPSPLPKAF